MRRRGVVRAVALGGLLVASAAGAQPRCTPTPRDAEGPFYKPGAPARQTTGQGLTVGGVVRSAATCSALAGARVEWWQASPTGGYDDAHRGSQVTGPMGAFRFSTAFPPPYAGRPSHIHVKAFAEGHRPLTTQIYPKSGQTEVTFDLVLLKE